MRSNDVKTKMKKAMVSLLRKKNYLQISVTDLVEEAGVARASFYRVYTSIDKVLEDVFADVKDEMMSLFVQSFVNGEKEKLKNNIVAFLNQIKTKSFPTINILPENRQYTRQKFENQFVSFKGTEYNSVEEKYRIPSCLFFVYSSSLVWEYCGFNESPEEIADYIIEKIYSI